MAFVIILTPKRTRVEPLDPFYVVQSLSEGIPWLKVITFSHFLTFDGRPKCTPPMTVVWTRGSRDLGSDAGTFVSPWMLSLISEWIVICKLEKCAKWEQVKVQLSVFFFVRNEMCSFFVSVRLSISRIKIMAGRSVVNEIEKREFDFRTVKNVN